MNKLTNIIIKASLVIVAFLGIFLFSTKFNQIYGNYECNNGPNNRDSNGCGRPCYNGEPWSKYEVNNSCGSLPFGWAWWGTNICAQRIGYICSTGDKCVSGEKGLRPGYCDCGSSGPLYKTCCSGSTPVNCNNYYQQDNYPPPEGTCAPNTMVDGGSCPCNCSTWTLGSCGASGCSSTQKPKIRTCDNDCATEFDGCENSSSCCSCSGWTARGCGEGSCGSLQRRYTWDCNPDGCQSESKCENDSSCCQCSGWSNEACGAAGGCPLGQRRQTRTCSPSGCGTTLNRVS